MSEEQVKEEGAVEVPEKFKAFVESIEKMTVIDLADLVKILEKKFGVSAAAPVAMVAAGGAAGAGAPAVEEKSAFTIELTETGANKINVIKVVKAISGLGLIEAKNLVEAAPSVVKENVKKEEADVMKKQLEEAGAKVTLK